MLPRPLVQTSHYPLRSLDLSVKHVQHLPLRTESARRIRKQDDAPCKPLRPAHAPGAQGGGTHAAQEERAKSRWRRGGLGAQTLTQLARFEVIRRKYLGGSLKKEQ